MYRFHDESKWNKGIISMSILFGIMFHNIKYYRQLTKHQYVQFVVVVVYDYDNIYAHFISNQHYLVYEKILKLCTYKSTSFVFMLIMLCCYAMYKHLANQKMESN